MNTNIVFLLQSSRKAYDKTCKIIEYDLCKKAVINKFECYFSDPKLKCFIGYYFSFYNWKKVKKNAILFYENDGLYFLYEDKKLHIVNVEVKKILFWKKIIINNEFIIKVFSPFYTLCLETDQFPDEVEPIYDEFLSLTGVDRIKQEIGFLEGKYNTYHGITKIT